MWKTDVKGLGKHGDIESSLPILNHHRERVSPRVSEFEPACEHLSVNKILSIQFRQTQTLKENLANFQSYRVS